MDKLIKNETNRYAKRFYEQINNAGYKLIKGEFFKNVSTPTQVKCNKGHVYETKPSYFKYGYRCKICRKESYENRFYNLLKEEFL